MVERVVWLAAGPEMRRAIGEAARARIASTFTVERMVSSTVALYEKVLRGPLR
jgi:glycosyltransferase involved in cell wall biosynthesis